MDFFYGELVLILRCEWNDLGNLVKELNTWREIRWVCIFFRFVYFDVILILKCFFRNVEFRIFLFILREFVSISRCEWNNLGNTVDEVNFENNFGELGFLDLFVFFFCDFVFEMIFIELWNFEHFMRDFFFNFEMWMKYFGESGEENFLAKFC